MKNKGLFVVWLSVFLTFFLFILAKSASGDGFSLSFLTLSQLLSLLGTVLLGISFLLSSRFRWIEDLFGGLDKVYRVHHMTGGIAFVMLLHHPIFLAVEALPDTKTGMMYLWFSNFLPYNFGIMALYTMILLLILTLVINLPYRLWLKTHEYMGVVLLLASGHILTITSDVSRFPVLRFWLVLWLFVALMAVVYKRFLYRKFGPKNKYVVESANKSGDVVELWLNPVHMATPYYPGQFVFISFESLGKELHPFSIASNGFDNRLRLDVKNLGDYTARLGELKQGELATVYGPYGKFYESLLGNKDLVFVAGGIGITPFLGMLDLAKKGNKQKIDLVYCAKTEAEMIFDKEIEEKVKGSEKLKYWKYCTNNTGHITAKTILDVIGSGVENKKFLLCGPTMMMALLEEQLSEMGVLKRNIIYENFNLK